MTPILASTATTPAEHRIETVHGVRLNWALVHATLDAGHNGPLYAAAVAHANSVPSRVR